jgi:hypothetical protein
MHEGKCDNGRSGERRRKSGNTLLLVLKTVQGFHESRKGGSFQKLEQARKHISPTELPKGAQS